MRKVYGGAIAVTGLVALLVGCGSGRPVATSRGAQLFKTCAPCHGEDGGGSLTLRTPSIAGLPDWYLRAELHKFAHDVRGAHPDDSEGHRMRPMARSLYHPGDVEAVAAYVSGLPRVPVKPMLSGNVAAGQTQFTTVCVACHGPDGSGNIAVGAPPIAGQADWYLVSQLEKFKTGMRGVNPDDTTGAQMRAMSMTLQDTTAMHDVVAYIKTLSH
ncbi:MAG: c-type cytochrome [Candidatus Eisenbacteria bacterium]